jgi:hypothetical protein
MLGVARTWKQTQSKSKPFTKQRNGALEEEQGVRAGSPGAQRQAGQVGRAIARIRILVFILHHQDRKRINSFCCCCFFRVN